MFKVISTVLAFVMALLSTAMPERKCDPVYTGTFLQSWMSCYWTEDRWAEEVDNMENVGIKYLILQDTANLLDDGTWEVFYDSDLDVFQNAEYVQDVVASALNACEGTGIQVFAGLAMFNDWWTTAGISADYSVVCDVMADMVTEMTAKYSNHDNFYGFYFTPEISNTVNMDLTLNSIIKGVNTVIDAVPDDIPMMLSPYFSNYLSLSSVLTAEANWTKLIKKVHFRDGDIFAPQDAVGAQWIKESDLKKVWKMYRTAVDSAEVDLKLWANCENFILARAGGLGSGILTPPETLNTSSVPCTIDRFARQLDIASRYAENIITFSYNHYHSPSYVNPAFEKTYLDYVKNDYVVETEKPTAPENLQNDNGMLTWTQSQDNMGISHYLIYRNKKAVAYIESQSDLEYTIDDNADYSIEAVDAAGNVSDRVYF